MADPIRKPDDATLKRHANTALAESGPEVRDALLLMADTLLAMEERIAGSEIIAADQAVRINAQVAMLIQTTSDIGSVSDRVAALESVRL